MPSLNNRTIAILLVVLITLFAITGTLANPYRTLGDQRTPLELAKASSPALFDAVKWDFVLIPVYTMGLALLCFIAGRAGARLQLVSLRLTWWIIAVVIAGAFIDVAENIALLRVSAGSPEKIWESIAEFGRIGKWLSPVVGNLYSFVVGIWCLLRIGSR